MGHPRLLAELGTAVSRRIRSIRKCRRRIRDPRPIFTSERKFEPDRSRFGGGVNFRNDARTLHYWPLAIGLRAVSAETQTQTIAFALKLRTMLFKYIIDTLLKIQGFRWRWCRVVSPPPNVFILTAEPAASCKRQAAKRSSLPNNRTERQV